MSSCNRVRVSLVFLARNLRLAACHGLVLLVASTALGQTPVDLVTASDGAYTSFVRVSWMLSTNGPPPAGYQLYRATTNVSALSSLVIDWISMTNYCIDDTPPMASVTYYYWMKSFDFAGSSRVFSAFSPSDSGYALPAEASISAPTGVSASDGTYADRVLVAWNPNTNAVAYEVYRNTSSSPSGASVIGSPSTAFLFDTNVSVGVTYYYWVKSYEMDSGTSQMVYSAFSSSDTGFRHPLPSAPSTVQATDGTHLDKVDVSWQWVSNAVGYVVYRATSSNGASATPIATVAGVTCSDTTAVAGVTYYYWVKSYEIDYADSQSVYSVFSTADSGYANQAPVAILTANPTSGYAPLRVTLDFSGSYDPNGSVVQVEIDKDGNGTYDASASSPASLVAEYTSPGSYTPAIRVTDNNGARTSTSAGVTVWGSGAPTAVLEATPTSGTAPLSVTFRGTNSTAAAGRTIAVYEWDADGDGSFERVTTNAMFSWVYGAPGTNLATLRVTDSGGLQDLDSQVIVVSPAANPPVATLSANPTAGTIPLTVTFTAGASGGGSIVAYRWDFDGDGAYDISTASNSVPYTYTSAGIYPATVTIVDDAGLSDSDSATITASVSQVLRVWVSTPKDGATLWGQNVSIRANTAPGSLTQALRFEYKRADEVSWTTLGGYMYTPANSFATNWDVTSLTDETNYNLRARALDLSTNEVVSDVVTVRISSGTSTNVGAIIEGVVDGKQQKEQVFSKDETTAVGVSDGTQVVVPAGTVDSNTTVTVVLLGLNTNAANGAAAGKAAIAANRRVSLGGDPSLAKPIEIIIPYDDVDNDGIVDGTGIPEMTLTAYWYDTEAGQWRRALSTEIFTEENYLRATTYHLTEFGLFGSKNLLHPANGSVLDGYTSEDSAVAGVQNLTDDNTISYWRSETNPASAQEMVYSFKDSESALITGAGIYNHGDGSEGYSRTFQIQGSINGADYTTLTSGVLAATGDAQIFSFGGSVTCRTVKLVVSDGVAADGWELAEFELYGDTTPDADDDTLTDAWEVQYFGDLASNNATNDPDEDGLDNAGERDQGTEPDNADTDYDGMNDGDEVIAGTSATNSSECFVVGQVDAYGDGGVNLLRNSGLETGWKPVASLPYWTDNILAGDKGGVWGGVDIETGETHSGTNAGVLYGTGSGDNTSGWWQQVTNTQPAGAVWEASAWLWSDAAYTNNRCELKIEFFDASESWLSTVFHFFDAPGEAWTHVSGLATAPVNTCFVRFVVVGVGHGNSGVMRFDDSYLAPYSRSECVIRWASVIGRLYKVYSSATLGTWTNVLQDVAGTGQNMAYTNRLHGEKEGYMRVTVRRGNSPDGGYYSITQLGYDPACSYAGHRLP